MKITRAQLKQIIKEEMQAMAKQNAISINAMNAEASSILRDIEAISAQQIAANQNPQQKIGEAAGLVAFSIALAVPKLLSLAGKFVNKFDGPEGARWFEEAGHKVHAAYIKAIIKVLTLIPQYRKAQPQIQKKIAEMVFIGIVGIMLGASAIGFVEQLTTMSNVPLGVTEGILSAIKQGEIRQYLIKQINSLLNSPT